MSTPENLPQVFEEDSIDLIALLKQIYQGRRFIILSAVVAAILGVIVALATPILIPRELLLFHKLAQTQNHHLVYRD